MHEKNYTMAGGLQDFLENIFKTVADGIIVTDKKGAVLRLNPAVEKITGFTKAELKGKHLAEFAPPEQPYRNIADRMMTALHDNKGFAEQVETVWLRKDGTPCPVELNISFLKDGNGIHTGLVISARDITHRKTTEKESSEAQSFLQTLIENSKDGIVITDALGHILSVNKAAENMYGFDRQELVGEHASMFTAQDKKLREMIIEKTRELFEKGYTIFETVDVTKDGKILDIECATAMVKDAEGNHFAAISIMRDITDRKKMEYQLRQAQKMEALGTLAGGIAHDFNNILAAIIGYAEIGLQKFNQSVETTNILQQVLKAADRARQLIKQIATFSRQTEHVHVPVKPALIIEEVIKLMRALLPTTIDIRHHCETNATIMADPTELHQVLMNLCANAGYAMSAKGGVLTLGLSSVYLDEESAVSYHGLTPGLHVRLTVADTGTGIDPVIIDRIFDPFFTTKEVGKGTGMGLAVVLGIVKNHDGAITVHSEPGRGTTFHILFPVAEDTVSECMDSARPLPMGKERLLLVDDEEELTAVGVQLLESLGYTVVSKNDSLEALELFRKNPEAFDLVITDLTMPHMTGYQLAREITAIRHDIPIILCSGYIQTVSPETALNAGIQAFVMKPMNLRELASTVRSVLDTKP